MPSKSKRILALILLLGILMLGGCTSKENTEQSVDVSTQTENTKPKDEDIKVSKEDNSASNIPEEEISQELASNVNKENSEEKVENSKESKPIQAPEKQENNDIAKTNSAEPSLAEAQKVEEKVEANTLKIQGNIANKLDLTLAELKSMNDIIFEDEFYSLNSFGTTGHTLFKGVKLWSLLEQKAKISPNASKITLIATDGYSMEFTVNQVKKLDYIDETNPEKKFPMIIAWEEKGIEYDVADGPPYKLIVGQKEAGDVNKPQWVSNIDRIIVE